MPVITNMSNELLACRCPLNKSQNRATIAVSFRYSDSEYKNRIIIYIQRIVLLSYSDVVSACVYVLSVSEMECRYREYVCMFTFTQDTRHSALFTRCVEQLLLLQEQCEESTHVIANGRIYCVSEFRTQKEPFRQEGHSGRRS